MPLVLPFVPVLADMVWPALFLEERILSVAPIAVGLTVEWLALWRGGFGLSWKKAIVVDIVMNAVSTVAGIFVIPVLGILWEYYPGSLIYSHFHIGTFNPLTWAVTFAIAVIATTLIEAAVVRWGFRISLGRRRFGILCAANVASVAIAFVSVLTHPPGM